jgi:DNA-binding NtrC family response regulator
MSQQKEPVRQLPYENGWCRGPVFPLGHGFEMVGAGASFLEMVHMLRHAAAWNQQPVLLTGERGSGKELAARSVHVWSDRRDRPFHAICVPALPESLLADELFGHTRGSFTGAQEARAGKFAAANGGTLFLDEIADISCAFQAALLRVLDLGEVQPVGADTTYRVDVRIITATNRDLHRLIEEKRLLPDLYDRIRFFEIRVPPLRQRREDIPLLATHFLRECCLNARCPIGNPDSSGCDQKVTVDCATPDFFQELLAHDWPGNLRELKSLIVRLRANNPETVLDASHVRNSLSPCGQILGNPSSTDLKLAPAIRRHIQSILRLTNFNITQAAKLLDVPRTTLYDHMKTLGIRHRNE